MYFALYIILSQTDRLMDDINELIQLIFPEDRNPFITHVFWTKAHLIGDRGLFEIMIFKFGARFYTR